MRDFQTFILVGGPGLVAGAIVGALVPRWRILIALTAAAAVVTWLGFERFAAQDGDDNHPLGALAAIATVLNFVGWLVGLTAGAVGRRATRRPRA